MSTTDTASHDDAALDEVNRLVDELLDTCPDPAADQTTFAGEQFDRGLAWVHFPVGLGGLDLSPKYQPIINDRVFAAGATNPFQRNPMGYGMCGPTIVEWGTPEQKEKYLRRIFTAEDIWCQLFSEPGAGSDVAGLATMADYHRTAAMETFTASNNDQHPTGLAGLRGARLVSANETEHGRQWAESRIKTLTGGDKIEARFMRQDFFEFEPQMKLFIFGNHKPGIASVDEAIRRRLHLIPFTVTIPANERDQELPERLKAEWPGILAGLDCGRVCRLAARRAQAAGRCSVCHRGLPRKRGPLRAVARQQVRCRGRQPLQVGARGCSVRELGEVRGERRREAGQPEGFLRGNAGAWLRAVQTGPRKYTLPKRHPPESSTGSPDQAR